jgi:hypothetical protein
MDKQDKLGAPKELLARLEGRAKSSRRKAFVVSAIVAALSVAAISIMIVGLLFRQQILDDDLLPTIQESTRIQGQATLENNPMLRGITGDIDQEITTGKTEVVYFAELMFQVLQAQDAEPEEIKAYADSFLPQLISSRDTISPIIISAVFSAGAIGIILLLIQISMNFVRYYVRLAEAYDAQADAVRAANGEPELVSVYLKDFAVTGIEFGKAPISVYERAIDAMAEVGKGAKK